MPSARPEYQRYLAEALRGRLEEAVKATQEAAALATSLHLDPHPFPLQDILGDLHRARTVLARAHRNYRRKK